MPPKVKICGLTRPEDARAATRLGADYLGVIFYPLSSRCVNPNVQEELLFFIPDGKRVMVDVDTEFAVLRKRLELGFDYYQLHFDISTPVERIKKWSEITGQVRLWLAPRIPPEAEFPEHILPFADTFVIDSYKAGEFGGTGCTDGWERFVRWKAAYPDKRFVLAGGLGPDNVAEAHTATGAAVMDLNSGVESEPGIKDITKMSAAIHAIRALD